jgi:hypothetical protein
MSAAARLFLFIVLSVAVPDAALAHVDLTTGQNYNGFQRNDGKGSCCDWHECRPAFAPFMAPDGEKIRDHGDNTYVFDSSKIVDRPSDDGNWHICGNATTLNCIIAPAQALRRDRLPVANRLA